LLSPNIHLHTTAIIYKFPQIDTSPASRSWHRDIGITQDLGHDCLFRAGIKVGYCLTDFLPSQSGFTLFAPGSHLFTTPLPIAEGEIDPENVVDLCLNAGDAFLFENRVFHTPAPNLSLHTSKVVLFGYSYRWMGGLQHDMALVRPHGDVLDQVDDIGKQLLGGTCSGLVDWASDQGIAPQTVEWTMQA
jgi:hypothetical protein